MRNPLSSSPSATVSGEQDMDRIKRKMMDRRRHKQADLEKLEPQAILIFGEGTAAIKGKWTPEDGGEPPVKYGKLPEWYKRV
jgi:hypothetical protein